jgi:MFS family permease
VLLSLYALDLGAQPAEIGVLVALYFAFPLLLAWPVGVWADRIGSRGLLLFGMTVGTLAMILPYFAPKLHVLYVAGTLAGLSFVFCSVLVHNLVGLLSKPEDRARNFSNSSLIGSASNILGPLVAGFGIDHVGHAIASLGAAALFFAGLALVAIWGGTLPGGGSGGRHVAVAQSSLRERLSDRAVMGIILTTTLLQIGQDLYMFYLPIYGHSIRLSASAIGSILAAAAAAACTIRVFLPALVSRVGEQRLLALSFFVAAATFLLIPQFHNPWMLGLISICFGLGFGCGQPITMMLLFSRAPAGRSGETVGLRHAVNNFGRVISPPIFGAIASMAGLLTVFVISALLMAAGGWVSKPKPAARAPGQDR